jgi:hypothetical protein
LLDLRPRPAIPDLNAVPIMNPTHSKDRNLASTGYNYNMKDLKNVKWWKIRKSKENGSVYDPNP